METVASDLAWKTVAFHGVGAADATYKLSQLNVKDTNFAQENMDYIATINEYGAQGTYYTWDPYYNDEAGAWFECDENVEILDPDTPSDNVELEMIQAIFINSLYGENITVSGEVLAGDTALYVVACDIAYTGNFTPSAITLGDLVVPAGEFAQENMDYVATINEYGAQGTYYTWDPYYDNETGAWFECDENIEILDPETPANNVEIPANTAFIINTLYGCEINIPSPIKK